MRDMLASLTWTDWIGLLLCLGLMLVLILSPDVLRGWAAAMEQWFSDDDDGSSVIAALASSGPMPLGPQAAAPDADRVDTPQAVALVIAETKTRFRDEFFAESVNGAALDIVMMAWLELALERLRDEYGEDWTREYIEAQFAGHGCEAIVGAVLCTELEAGLRAGDAQA